MASPAVYSATLPCSCSVFLLFNNFFISYSVPPVASNKDCVLLNFIFSFTSNFKEMLSRTFHVLHLHSLILPYGLYSASMATERPHMAPKFAGGGVWDGFVDEGTTNYLFCKILLLNYSYFLTQNKDFYPDKVPLKSPCVLT